MKTSTKRRSMAKKKPNKLIHILMEYPDNESFKLMMNKIKDQVSSGSKTINRETYFDGVFEYRVHKDEGDNFREEMINGVMCRVYPSKMNKTRS